MFDSITETVAVGDIVASPFTHVDGPINRRRGPVIAMVVAMSILVVGAVALLVRSQTTSPASSPASIVGSAVIDAVVSGSEGDARFSVGLNTNGDLCAEAGSTSMSEGACGGTADLTVVAFQADTGIAIGGYALESVGGLTAVYDGDFRRTLTLTPVPGEPMLAFGSIEQIEPDFVEIEVTDETGEVVKRYFPSIGPGSD